jgi:hypothetical protein
MYEVKRITFLSCSSQGQIQSDVLDHTSRHTIVPAWNITIEIFEESILILGEIQTFSHSPLFMSVHPCQGGPWTVQWKTFQVHVHAYICTYARATFRTTLVAFERSAKICCQLSTWPMEAALKRECIRNLLGSARGTKKENPASPSHSELHEWGPMLGIRFNALRRAGWAIFVS